MKRALSALLSTILLLTALTLFPVSVGALITAGDYQIAVNYPDNGEAILVAYTGSAEKLTIPAELEGYRITAIAGMGPMGAFAGNQTLKSITIPDHMTIDSNSFYNCTSLAEIQIPDTVTYIGMNAFAGTAWYNAQPDGVVYAGKVAYNIKGDCPKEVTVNDGTVSIGEGFCRSQKTLERVVLPDSVRIIGVSAFGGCPSLASVTLPNTVEIIGSDAFDHTPWLSAWLEAQPDGLVMLGKAAYQWKGNCPAEVVLPAGTASISAWAFSGCSTLERITLPGSLTDIGYKAFYNCPALKQITIPASVTHIGADALGVYNDPETNQANVRVEGFTIVGTKGSAAEYHAQACGYLFITADEALLGDADGDGTVTILDATAIQRTLAGIETAAFMAEVADADGDGELAILDATAIQRWLASLPANEAISKPLKNA